jgi:hypothetical protein
MAHHHPQAIAIGGDNGERTEAIWPRTQKAKEDGTKEAEREQCRGGLWASARSDGQAPFKEGLRAVASKRSPFVLAIRINMRM